MALRNILAPRQQVTTAAGNVLAGGKVFLFEPGTTTFVTSFRDSGLVVPHTNPVRLSGSGRANIWVSRDVDMFIVPRTNVSDLIPTDVVLQELRANPDALGVDEAGGLVPNGSFEIDTDADLVPDSWTLSSEAGATNALDTSESTDGAQSFRFTSSGSGGGSLVADEFFPVNDVDPLRVNLDLRSTVAAVRNIVRVEWYDVSQVFISASDAYDSTANPLVFTTQNLVAIPPALARFAKLRLIGVDPSVALAGSTFFDRVSVFYPAVVTGVFDNITIQNNEIITTNLNGDLNLRPNGTGSTVMDFNGSPVARSQADGMRVLTDIVTATPPTNEAVTASWDIYDQGNDDVLAQLGFPAGSNELQVRNYMHGGNIVVRGEDAAGVSRNILVGDPDGFTSMYDLGVEKVRTNSVGARLAGSVVTATPPTTEAVDTRLELFDADFSDVIAQVGFDASNDLRIRNVMHGGQVILEAEDAAGVSRALLSGDPDTGVALGAGSFSRFITTSLGRVIIRSDGNSDLDNRHIRLEHADGTLRGVMGYDGAGTGQLTLANQINGVGVLLQAFDAGGVNRALFTADPDGAAELGFQGIFTARSAAAASGGLEANNTLTGAGFERVLTASDLIDAQTGSFTGTLTGFAVNPTGTINFAITGNHCTLYNDGALISATSNATSMTMTGLPAAVQPANATTVGCEALRDNSINANSGAATISGAVVSFLIGNPKSGSGFTALGDKGVGTGWSITYPLA